MCVDLGIRRLQVVDEITTSAFFPAVLPGFG